MKYQPPYKINSKIIHLIAEISEALGRLTVLAQIQDELKLRKANRIRTIQGSLAIEGNTLSEEQITKSVTQLKPMNSFNNGNQLVNRTY